MIVRMYYHFVIKWSDTMAIRFRKSFKAAPGVRFKKVRMEEELNREPETAVDDVIELPGDTVSPETSEPPKPKLWLWALMAVVLVCGLWYLFGNGINRPEVSNETPTSGVITTTQFTYAAEDAEPSATNFFDNRRGIEILNKRFASIGLGKEVFCRLRTDNLAPSAVIEEIH